MSLNLLESSNKQQDTYKGAPVVLDSPEKLDGDEMYTVYSRNSKDEVVKVRFSGSPTPVQSKDKSTPAYWNEKLAGIKFRDFKHRVFFDMSTKTIRSVRDGVQEYLGVELGIEPYDKAFTVYRSPETISALASDMDGLPIIDDHIDPSSPPAKELIIGHLSDTCLVEELVGEYDSTLVTENKANISNEMLKLRDGGKKEFSLGYTGKMREHDVYDFEQYDLSISTGHLALVDAARGGSMLTFIDKETSKMKNIFLDADGTVNLQKVVEITQQLPEAMKNVPLEQLSEVIPVLEEVVMYGKENDESAVVEDIEGEEELTDEDKEEFKAEGKEELMDMEYEDMEEEDKEKFEDSKLFKSIVKSKNFKDAKSFADAVAKGVKAGVESHTAVTTKAREFLPESYSFGDKSATQIMRDSIASVSDDKFTDSELPAAFKMLNKSNQYKSFGDSADSLQALKDKEL
jgi:hypothetical protein